MFLKSRPITLGCSLVLFVPSCLYFVYYDTDTTDWNQTKPIRLQIQKLKWTQERRPNCKTASRHGCNAAMKWMRSWSKKRLQAEETWEPTARKTQSYSRKGLAVLPRARTPQDELWCRTGTVSGAWRRKVDGQKTKRRWPNSGEERRKNKERYASCSLQPNMRCFPAEGSMSTSTYPSSAPTSELDSVSDEEHNVWTWLMVVLAHYECSPWLQRCLREGELCMVAFFVSFGAGRGNRARSSVG